MLSAAMLDAIGIELEELVEDGSEAAALRAEELAEALEAAVEVEREQRSEPVQQKLRVLIEDHPWLAREQVELATARIANENASMRSKRGKVIAIANRMTQALAPHVACKAGCSQCCHMNTVIYEHEAIRLAAVSGRKMADLPIRTRAEAFAEGARFSGKPCPFLVENQCSVYDDRPLVCRTHHSLREDAAKCSMEIPTPQQVRAPMYDADAIETPYYELNVMHNPLEPCGNIAEFFPD